jgi:hypothetical protein
MLLWSNNSEAYTGLFFLFRPSRALLCFRLLWLSSNWAIANVVEENKISFETSLLVQRRY